MPAGVKHGLSHTVEYKAWKRMLNRCRGEWEPRYKERGIMVCAEWSSSFTTFLDAVGPRPGPGYSLDRIDNSQGYKPGNVRWATAAQQARNRSNNICLEYEGDTMTIAEWARRVGLPVPTLWQRIKLGWNVRDALTRPADQRRRRRIK